MSEILDFPQRQRDSDHEQQNTEDETGNVFAGQDELDDDLKDTGSWDDSSDYSDEYDDGSLNSGRGSADADTAARRRQQLQRILKMVVAGALIVGIVLLIVLQSRTRVYGSATYRKMADLSAAREGTTYRGLGSNIVAYSRDGASCMNTSGTLVWNITYEMQQPIVAVSGNVIAIGDYNGSEIHIMNDTQVLGSVDTNMPIRGLAVSQSGEVAAVLNDTDVTWVYLFKPDGSTIAYFKTTMSKSGYPLSVAISPGGKLVGVSHLTAGSASVNTSVAFYNFGSVGQNKTDNRVDGYNYEDEVFPYLAYMNNNTCAAVSDKRLVFFHGDEIPKSGTNAMFDTQVQGVYSDSQYIAVLFPDTTGQEEYALNVYNTSGSLVSTIRFTLDFNNIQLCGGRIVISNDQTLIIANADGTMKYRGNFQTQVRAVIPSETSTNRLTVITDDALEQMILE